MFRGQEEFVEEFCFAQNSYYIPIDMEIPAESELRKSAEIGEFHQFIAILAVSKKFCVKFFSLIINGFLNNFPT